ncbi:MAG: endolytic transglycosylase MltG [Ruminococcus sp.]|nr:endolytic transglycosylase MltG [Ruminococcus sp.]
MENKKQNQEEALLEQILRETSLDALPKREVRKEPVISHAAEPAQEEASNAVPLQEVSEETPFQKEAVQEPPMQTDPIPVEEKTTIHKAVQASVKAKPYFEAAAPTSRIRTPEEEALYEDLDGISQTQIHQRKVNASRSKKKKRRKGLRALRSIIMTILILGVSILLAVLIITYGRDILGINNNNTTKIVTIPQGADTEEIAEILEAEGIITYPKVFTIFAGMSGKDVNFTAGDHELRPDMAYDTIFENLASPSLGSADVVDIAFQEGITLVEAAERLEEQGVCDADEFIEYFNEARFDFAFESHLPSFTTGKFYKMEGYLFPDTYQFYQDMDVDLVCQKILRNFNSKITDRDYARMEELGISLDETLTLASIIQMEAGSLDQMSRISSVFWNRMNNSETYPKLQSDPTINYVEDVIKPHISSYDEEMFSGYNTYECDGLPAGAISNPGYDAIQAALYPASTDYFYFYSNLNTGETYFSKTLSEHEAWIERVEGNQYVATEPMVTLPQQSGEDIVVGVGTSVGTAPAQTATTTQVVIDNIW